MTNGFFTTDLAHADKEIFGAIQNELGRQQHQVELIASENIVSRAVLEAQGSVLTNKYGFLYLRNKDGLGLGDVKLLFGVGIWLASSAAFVPFLFFSGMLGVLCGLGWRWLGRGAQFPFGPALAIALLMCVVWPESVQQFWGVYGVSGHR